MSTEQATTTTTTVNGTRQEEDAGHRDDGAVGVPFYLRPNQLQRAMNERMAELVPELRSSWATTPMARSRWLEPSASTDGDEPCFVASAQNSGMKINYVWMPQRKDLPAGYYHLATQEAYIQINHLLRKARPRRRFDRTTTSSNSREDRELYRQIQNLLSNRLVTDLPDDVHAQRVKMLGLQSSGGKAAAFGKAAFLPTLTTSLLLSLGGR